MVIIADRRDSRSISGKRYSAERPSIFLVAAEKFSGKMLTVGGRSAVATSKNKIIIPNGREKNLACLFCIGSDNIKAALNEL